MFIPVTNNEIPEPPMQMVYVICSDLKRLKILAGFAPNLKRNITAYKTIERVPHG